MLQLAPAPLLNILIINNTAPISHSLIASTLLFSDWLASTLLICSDFSAGTLLISDLTELVNGFWLVWWGSHSSTLHSLKYSNLTTYQLSLNYFPFILLSSDWFCGDLLLASLCHKQFSDWLWFQFETGSQSQIWEESALTFLKLLIN